VTARYDGVPRRWSALVVSYNVNSSVGTDIFLDVRDYRPRFLDVTLS